MADRDPPGCPQVVVSTSRAALNSSRRQSKQAVTGAVRAWTHRARQGSQMFKRAALLSSLTLLGVLLATAPALANVGLSPSPSQLEFGEVDLHYGGSPRQSVSFSDAA